MSNEHSPPDPLDPGADQVRETVKWLAAALAAVAAVMLAGAQLSSLAAVEGIRLALALFGLVIGLLGVGWAIWLAVRNLRPVATTLELLIAQKGSKSVVGLATKAVEELDGLMQGFGPTMEQLRDQYLVALDERKIALDENNRDPTDKTKVQRAQAANIQAAWVSGVVQNVLAVAKYEILWLRFSRSLRWIFLAAGLAAIGITTFAYASSPPPDDATGYEHVSRIAVPSQEVNRVLERNGGEPCHLPGQVEALLLSHGKDELDLVTIPTEECPSVQLRLPSTTPVLLVP